MSLSDLSEVRVLLLARKGGPTQVLRTVLGLAGLTKITSMGEPHGAIGLLCIEPFHAVFVEGAVEHDGMPFALAARRLPALINPMIPIFAMFPEARKCDVETARDLGVHDVIGRPVSVKTIVTKLRAVLTAPRPFIAAPSFFGPDRRAQSRAGVKPVQERRGHAAKKTKLPTAFI